MDARELLFLHALPLDGSMWEAQRQSIPWRSHAPTLYGFGDALADWAKAALALTDSRKLILIGCSVGGSCALEIAALAPERVAGVMLIGTKADRRPDPSAHAQSSRLIREEGRGAAWQRYWRPLFATSCPDHVTDAAQGMMMRHPEEDIARGVDVFHTRQSRGNVLAALSCPVAVVTGDEDCAPGIKTSSMQAQMAPIGKLHVVKSSGHYVPLEQPSEFTRSLDEFVIACD